MRQVFAFSLLCLVLLGCGGRSTSKKNMISVSIVPEKYFVEQIAGNDFEINIIIPPGTSHSDYDPSPGNMTAIAHSVGYFRIGDIGFEKSLIDKIENLNPDLSIYDLSENILPHSEKISDNHGHAGHHHHHQDQHIWMSARKAKIIAENIYKAVVDLKPERKDFYSENLAVFQQKMDSLDSITQRKLADLSVRSFVIFHPALTYYAEDYGLEQIALEIDGKEPSVAWMQEVAKQIEAKHIRVIFTQGEFSQAAATAVAETTGVELQAIDPLSEHWYDEFERITDIISEKMK